MTLHVGYYKKAYFHFQKFIELDRYNGCAICDFNRMDFREQKERYLSFLQSQRVHILVKEVNGYYSPEITYKGKKTELRQYLTEESAYRTAIKESFKILNEHLVI